MSSATISRVNTMMAANTASFAAADWSNARVAISVVRFYAVQKDPKLITSMVSMLTECTAASD